MDYGEFYDESKKASQRLLRYYACAVAEEVYPLAKTRSVLEAINWGYWLAQSSGWHNNRDILKLEEKLKTMRNVESFQKRLAREAGLLCIASTINLNMFVSVVNGIRQFKGKDFDDKIMKCVRLGHTRRPGGTQQPDILAMSKKMFDERDWEVSNVLADAMEDYQILDSQEHLTHLRGDCHWRGCWVLDEIFGFWQ